MQSEGHLLLKYLQAAQRGEIIAQIQEESKQNITERFPQYFALCRRKSNGDFGDLFV